MAAASLFSARVRLLQETAELSTIARPLTPATAVPSLGVQEINQTIQALRSLNLGPVNILPLRKCASCHPALLSSLLNWCLPPCP
jgi:hypothetical protein